MNKKKQYIAPEMAVVVMEQLMVSGASIESSKHDAPTWQQDDSSEGVSADEAW